jgi:probable FeS assembly SUF system protein SufT
VSYEETIELKRDAEAVSVPQGTAVRLSAGEKVYLMQAPGGSFMIQRDDGQLVRLALKDADAIGKEPLLEEKPREGAGTKPDAPADEKAVWDALKTCYDPEIPVNLVDLGLIYSCRLTPDPQGGSQVEVVMTLTAPGCGMADVIRDDVAERIRSLPGVAGVRVEVTFDPPWEPSRMTDAARLQLGMY